MSKEEELVETIKVLRQEVEVLTTRVKPAGTGHLITAIGVINGRIDELMLEAIAPMLEEDVYDGYKEHTEAMEQARLRAIQDSAAGRKPNKVRDAYLWSANKEGHWSPDEPIDRKAVTQEEMSRLYNNGPHIGARENDDGTWDMSAAARMATDDDVKHTEEYYTGKDRNRPNGTENL